MERQITDYNTFLDDIVSDDKIYNIEFFMKNNGKKRILKNKAIVDYLNGQELDEEAKQIVSKAKAGVYAVKDETVHCKICSGNFKFYHIDELNKKLAFWNIGIPTQQYTPFGLMVYLKHPEVHKENFYDLTIYEIAELKQLMKELYMILSNSDFDYNVVGINMMFNQITTSQKCIHGHIELMIKDVHKENLGARLALNTRYDESNKLVSSNQHFGYQMKITDLDEMAVLLNTKKYFEELYGVINKYRNNKALLSTGELNLSEVDKTLTNMLTPAPVANVYLSYYRDEFILTITPEIFLEPITSENIHTDEDIYKLKYSYDTFEQKFKLLYESAPIMRPSIKKNIADYDIDDYGQKQNKLIKILGRN